MSMLNIGIEAWLQNDVLKDERIESRIDHSRAEDMRMSRSNSQTSVRCVD